MLLQYFSHIKKLFEKNMNKKIMQSTWHSVSLCALGTTFFFFSNKDNVTLILHLAHSVNDMNMAEGN